MSEHIKKFYTCDRCGVEMDAPVRGNERGPTAYTLTATEDFGVAGGRPIDWRDLCSSCNSAVGEWIRLLRDGAKSAQRNQTNE